MRRLPVAVVASVLIAGCGGKLDFDRNLKAEQLHLPPRVVAQIDDDARVTGAECTTSVINGHAKTTWCRVNLRDAQSLTFVHHHGGWVQQ